MSSGLTPKQVRFVEEYLIDLNSVRAYLRVYGGKEASARANAARLIAKDSISAAIVAAKQERSKRTRIDQDRVIQELAHIAFSDLCELAEWGCGKKLSLKDSARLTPENRRLVHSIAQTVTKEGGSLTIKLHDKIAALRMLALHTGVLEPRKEVDESEARRKAARNRVVDMVLGEAEDSNPAFSDNILDMVLAIGQNVKK